MKVSAKIEFHGKIDAIASLLPKMFNLIDKTMDGSDEV